MKGHPKYKIGDKVFFKCNNKFLHGEIYIVDKFGAFECDDVSYDIYVVSENMLYKHIEEQYLFLEEPEHLDCFMERDYRKMLRKFRPSKLIDGAPKFIHEGNITYCDYLFTISLCWLLKNDDDDLPMTLLNAIAKKFNGEVISQRLGRIRFGYVSKTKCSPSDEFNESVGEKIALIKAKRQSLRIAFQVTDFIQHYFHDLTNRCTSYKLEVDSMLKSQDNYLNKVCQS